MPTNRHAQIRYTILDQCFSNFNRLYNYDDLLEEINNKLRDIGTEGIKLRQLQYDIQHMQSSEGWSVEFQEGLKKGRKKAFRYNDKKFSISNNPLNVDEIEQLETTLTILSRYKHREEFSWLEELIPRIEQAFDLVASGEDSIISYQQNVDLKGLEYLGTLFNLIVKHKQLKLAYQPFNKAEQTHILNPLHLKQYNNRWFLFGFNPEYNSLSIFALDRINDLEELPDTFTPNDINWLDYFDDIIGVTHPEGDKIETIKLRFSEKRISYVKTKPLHGTQRILKDDPHGLTISIEVIPNKELYQLLLSFGHHIEVISPQRIRKEMIDKISEMNKVY